MCPVTNLAMTWQRWCIISLFIFKKNRHNYLKRLTNISFIDGPVPKVMLLLLITRLRCCFKADDAKYMLWALINLQSQGHFRMSWNSVAALCLWYLLQYNWINIWVAHFFVPFFFYFCPLPIDTLRLLQGLIKSQHSKAFFFYGGTWRQ